MHSLKKLSGFNKRLFLSYSKFCSNIPINLVWMFYYYILGCMEKGLGLFINNFFTTHFMELEIKSLFISL